MQSLKLLQSGKRAKVYLNVTTGDYVVFVLRTHNFDGIIEQCWDIEIFKDDGQYSGGGVPIRYYKGDKKEIAFAFASQHNNLPKKQKECELHEK